MDSRLIAAESTTDVDDEHFVVLKSLASDERNRSRTPRFPTGMVGRVRCPDTIKRLEADDPANSVSLTASCLVATVTVVHISPATDRSRVRVSRLTKQACLLFLCLFVVVGCQTIPPATDAQSLAKELERQLGPDWVVLQHEDHITLLSSEYLIWSHSTENSYVTSMGLLRLISFAPMEINLTVHTFIPESDYEKVREAKEKKLESMRIEKAKRDASKDKKSRFGMSAFDERYHALRLQVLWFPTRHNGHLSVSVDNSRQGGKQKLISTTDLASWVGKEHHDSDDLAPPYMTDLDRALSNIGHRDPQAIEDSFWQTLDEVLPLYPAAKAREEKTDD